MTDDVILPHGRTVAAPTWSSSLKVLVRADSTAQVRTSLSLVLTFALPLILLVATGLGKNSAVLGGPAFRISLALTVGLVSIGTVGYSLAIARDRDTGVFQRLRVTPAPTWTIMASRWIVQLGAVLVMAIVVLVVAAVFVGITLPPQNYLFTVLVALLGSAVFLSIGQAIVGLIASADTLNAAGRLLYVPLIGLSLFGDSDRLGMTVELVSRWSPGGCLETLLSAAMGATAWSGQSWGALFASFGYTVVFAVIGIRWFQWGAR